MTLLRVDRSLEGLALDLLLTRLGRVRVRVRVKVRVRVRVTVTVRVRVRVGIRARVRLLATRLELGEHVLVVRLELLE